MPIKFSAAVRLQQEKMYQQAFRYFDHNQDGLIGEKTLLQVHSTNILDTFRILRARCMWLEALVLAMQASFLLSECSFLEQLLHTFGKAVTAEDMQKVMISFTPDAITERDFINLMASKLVLPNQARNTQTKQSLGCGLIFFLLLRRTCTNL